jgi:hypothetical protein
MFFVAGRIADKAVAPSYGVVEFGGRNPWDADSMLANIAINKGGDASDYNLFTAADDSTEATRINRGDEWVPTWTGDAITAIDFSIEDAKKWIQVTSDKTSILSDGVEKVMFKIFILKADLSGVDDTFEGTLDIPVSGIDGSSKLRVHFFKGKGSREYSTTLSTKLIFPATKIAEYRIDSTVTIETIA